MSEKQSVISSYNEMKNKLQLLQIAYTREQIHLKSIIKTKVQTLKKNSSKLQSHQNSFYKDGQRNISQDKIYVPPEHPRNIVNDNTRRIKMEMVKGDVFSIEGKQYSIFDEQESGANTSNSISSKDQDKPFKSDYYDYKIKMNSFPSLSKNGWKFNISTKYISMKEDGGYGSIGFLGEFNSGKTFLMSQICGKTNTSYEEHTDNLCFKFNGNNVYIDSKGSNLPINCLDASEKNNKLDERQSYHCKELFIDNFILNESQVVIYVMGYASQFQIDKLNYIKNLKAKYSMLVVHNLSMLTSLNELANYYREVIQPAFNLHKEEIFGTSNDLIDNNEIVGNYFKETNEDEDNNSKREVIHLLYGNAKESAFNELNKATIQYIRDYASAKIGSNVFKIDTILKDNIIKILSTHYNVYQDEKLISEISNITKDLKFENDKKQIYLDGNYIMNLKSNCDDEVFKVKEYRDSFSKDDLEYTIQFCLPQKPLSQTSKIIDKIINQKRKYILEISGDLELNSKPNGITLLNDQLPKYQKYQLIINLVNIKREIDKEISSSVENAREIIFKYSLKNMKGGEIQQIDID